MRGRIFGVKKSYILSLTLVVLIAAFLSLSLVSIFVFKLPSLWFFILCGCTGIYQLLKGLLFRFDSALYFGALMLGIFGVGLGSTFAYLQPLPLFYILSFAAASYLTYVVFAQKFHLFVAITLYFIGILFFLYKINLIRLYIFVALTAAIVLIFILSYTGYVKFCKRS